MSDTAPLIATPDAPIPPGAQPAWFTGAGGAQLRAALFTPPVFKKGGRARGSIVLSGGRTEPIEKYFEFIGDLMDRGFVVLAHDWRGQGLSQRSLGDPLKGHADGAKPYMDDFRILLDTYAGRLPKPWVAVAHSMGGCLTLLAMSQGEDRFAGAIFSAPMLGVNTGGRSAAAARLMVSVSKLFGRARRYVLGDPGKPFDDVFDTNVLTHDRRRYARACAQLAAEPKLALGGPTWGWLDFALKAAAELARPERLSHITVPVIIVSAEDDKLVDNAAQAAAARHLPQGKFINVPGAFHEILMESDHMRNIFMRALDALTGRVAPTPAKPPQPTPATPLRPLEPAAAPAMAAAASKAPAAKKPAAKKKPTAKKPAAKKAPARAAAAKKSATAKKPAAKKATAKKPAAKKPAAKPAAAKKPPTARKPAAKKSARKPAAKKASAKKSAAKPAAAKKAPVAKKPAAKKPAAKKPAARKPAARKPAAKKAPAKT